MMNIDINNLKSLIEIPLDAEPNYSFDIFLADKSYQIKIRTFVNNDTRISIFNDNEIIADNAPINMYSKNLAFYSNFKTGVFFFLRNVNMKNEPTFLNFNENDLRLFYGDI